VGGFLDHLLRAFFFPFRSAFLGHHILRCFVDLLSQVELAENAGLFLFSFELKLDIVLFNPFIDQQIGVLVFPSPVFSSKAL